MILSLFDYSKVYEYLKERSHVTKFMANITWILFKGVNRPRGSGSVTIGSIIDDDAPRDAWEMGRGSILKRQGERHMEVNGDLPLTLDAPLDARCGYTLKWTLGESTEISEFIEGAS